MNQSYLLSTYARSPCYTLTFTYLAPSRCDRNRPPWSQVVCKLLPLVPNCSLVSSPPKSHPFSDFPKPNVHLIKARLNPFPNIPNNKHHRHLCTNDRSTGMNESLHISVCKTPRKRKSLYDVYKFIRDLLSSLL